MRRPPHGRPRAGRSLNGGAPSGRSFAPGGALAIALAAVCFGSLSSVSRLAFDQGVDPLGFSAWRAAIGAAAVTIVVIVGLARARSSASSAESGSGVAQGVWSGRVPPRQLANLAIATVANLSLNLAIFTAFSRLSVTLALLAFYTYPAMVAAASALLGIERFDRVRIAALAGSLAGMAVVVLGSFDANGVRLDALGIGLAVFAAICQTAYILVGRAGFSAVPPLRATAAVLGGSTIGYAVIAAVSGSAGAVVSAIALPGVWPLLLLGGIAGAALPQILFLLGVRSLGGTRTGIVMLLEPVTGVVLAALILGEPILPIQLVGGALVLGSALLLQVAGRTVPEPAAPAV